jgi:glycerophosphoryl diester phosphodiesterase
VRLLRFAPLLALAGCASTPAAGPARDLGQWFDCLRTRGEAVVSAHRGGPADGLPENALGTLDRTLRQVPGALLEIDVQQSADGVLLLFHDDRLDRKSTGSGKVQDRPWADLARLQLRDRAGAVTAEPIPTLNQALQLIVRRGAVAQLDIKRGVDVAAIIAAVRTAGAGQHVILITYNDEDALVAARLAPELMISATLRDGKHADKLVAAGIGADRLLAWTGTRSPDARRFAELRARGIEVIFGTLGSGDNSLDVRWLADGDPREFAELEAIGATLVATDRAAEVAAALGPVSCGR